MKESIIGYTVYENSNEFLGIADITLPDIERKSIEIQGAGMNGTVNSPVLGQVNAMSMTFNFRTHTKEQHSLFEGRVHTLDLREAVQGRNPITGEVEVTPHKYVVKVMPTKLSKGKLAPASTADASGEYAVSYFAEYIAGKKITEIDPYNYICIINGIDELANVRKALGK
ncbi:MAG: phage major tail tube protein [Clostridia bacterium]|nr:phage major tail tube protein [Clostridia bacterium]